MDDEDLADAAEAQTLQTAGDFSGLGDTQGDTKRKGLMPELVKNADTMGAKLLQRMGWRQGQGIGPKVRRTARFNENDGADNDLETHLYAPDNSRMISFVRKNDRKGLGYVGEASLEGSLRDAATPKPEEEDEDELQTLSFGKRKTNATKKIARKGGIGTGPLNDTGSDDDDPYAIGPKISYNKTIGKEKKIGRLDNASTKLKSSNPLLGVRPTFVSKKEQEKRAAPGFRKCHDGRLPLDGFMLSTRSASTSQQQSYPPPKVPEGWKSSKQHPKDTPQAAVAASSSSYQSSSDLAKSSTLDPKSRAHLLGEAALPGKSIFDFLSPAARNRLASASGKRDLPLALGEAPPEAFRKSEAEKQRALIDRLPHLDKDIAVAALGRGVGGWMPYADDEAKRARYREFLELKAGLKAVPPERRAGVGIDEYLKEMGEFAHAAMVFRPMSGMMATRFTPSARTYEGGTSQSAEDGESLLNHPAAARKAEDPAEAAAKIGMFGPMTRSVQSFYPTRLLCKRFNVRPPAHVEVDPDVDAEGNAASSSTSSKLDVVSQTAIDAMMREASLNRAPGAAGTGAAAAEGVTARPKEVVVDVEKNEALEVERPGDDIFKAIFGDEEDG